MDEHNSKFIAENDLSRLCESNDKLGKVDASKYLVASYYFLIRAIQALRQKIVLNV